MPKDVVDRMVTYHQALLIEPEGIEIPADLDQFAGNKNF